MDKKYEELLEDDDIQREIEQRQEKQEKPQLELEQEVQPEEEEQSVVLEGHNLDRMDDDRLLSYIQSCSIVARATPLHKYRLVKVLQKAGHVVLVTGDGVNDGTCNKTR